jgi:hypothetical protein
MTKNGDPKLLLQAQRDLHSAVPTSKTIMNMMSDLPLNDCEKGQVQEVE